MTEQTPLERLDVAIHQFVRDADAAEGETEPGQVGAWVLSYEQSRLDTDAEHKGTLPLVYASNYATGPVGSLATALGLLQVTKLQIQEAFSAPYESDED